ncbi:Mitochondrial inner membrane protein OXA1L [Chionoecetes opilio]|uniref:Mitochondrial inner membrane protein OXA1L n=1 Tax=Chionoecetes opilio TaxID=41210 RepID=A0A8J4YP02_CHIOP|nr:Mitochondrial inner membrane protein OXA1L [Chionoecetes opilio]
MFMGLRKMANLPVESLTEGGLWWFTDLTLADPYYILPIITSCTMLATIELGTDGAKLSAQNMQAVKYVLRIMPFALFPFTMNFPAAVLCYWVSTNLFSLAQVGFLRLPAMRDYFTIERMVTHKPESLPNAPKKGIAGFKESWKNMSISREIEDRHRYDQMRFRKAGLGPLVRITMTTRSHHVQASQVK